MAPPCGVFVASKPGVPWAGMPCKECGNKKADHAADACLPAPKPTRHMSVSGTSFHGVSAASSLSPNKSASGRSPSLAIPSSTGASSTGASSTGASRTFPSSSLHAAASTPPASTPTPFSSPAAGASAARSMSVSFSPGSKPADAAPPPRRSPQRTQSVASGGRRRGSSDDLARAIMERTDSESSAGTLGTSADSSPNPPPPPRFYNMRSSEVVRQLGRPSDLSTDSGSLSPQPNRRMTKPPPPRFLHATSSAIVRELGGDGESFSEGAENESESGGLSASPTGRALSRASLSSTPERSSEFQRPRNVRSQSETSMASTPPRPFPLVKQTSQWRNHAVSHVLRDAELNQQFRDFLKKEWALESFEFWAAVQEYTGDKKDAEKIFNEFVKQGSEQEVNLPSTMVGKIASDLKEELLDGIFEAAEDEITGLLARDKLPRFLEQKGVREKLDKLERGTNLVTAQITMQFPFRKKKTEKATAAEEKVGGGVEKGIGAAVKAEAKRRTSSSDGLAKAILAQGAGAAEGGGGKGAGGVKFTPATNTANPDPAEVKGREVRARSSGPMRTSDGGVAVPARRGWRDPAAEAAEKEKAKAKEMEMEMEKEAGEGPLDFLPEPCKFVPAKPGPVWGGMECKLCGKKKSEHVAMAPPVKKEAYVSPFAGGPPPPAAAGTCAFVASKPGPVWGGMACKVCGKKKSEHKEVAKAASMSALAGTGGARKAGTGVGNTVGTKQGSLGNFMGQALGIKHKGASSGMVRSVVVDDDDPDGTRKWHGNREAAKDQARLMAAAVMGGAKDVSSKSAKLGNFLRNKIGSQESM
ncbi:hypothetical protein TeGR_g4414 [Tetraparma gracilis]|uniref:RGS domain-containing protein n=1 Tax=Tetraparma gracilis TaxID=2962635 RepID=A0ABQ6N3K6_9STRA|nr:hypothetical protein TeGR_g4414 [Tetraparma gracilis]